MEGFDGYKWNMGFWYFWDR